MIGSTFRPSDRYVLRAVAREVWNDLPLLVPVGVMIGFGLVLASPTGTFAQSHAWDVLATIAKLSRLREAGLGVLFTTSGLTCLLCMFRLPRWYPHAAIAMAGAFSLIAISLYLAVGAASTGTICYTGMALLSLWGPFHAAQRPATTDAGAGRDVS